jgi:DNA-binding protein HU-beta
MLMLGPDIHEVISTCESPAKSFTVRTTKSVLRWSIEVSEPMNKSELIAKVAHDTRLTRGEAEEVVDSTIENIIKALTDGDDVRLMGFGVFTVTRRAGGVGRNPKTGKVIKMPASNRARFKPGKLLKEAVNS